LASPGKRSQEVPLDDVNKRAYAIQSPIDIVKLDTSSDTESDSSSILSNKEATFKPCLDVVQPKSEAETMGMDKDLNDMSNNLPKITLSHISDQDEETQLRNLYTGNFTDSTSQSDKEEMKEDLNPKMLISLEAQEASLVRKLVHLKKKTSKSTFFDQNRQKISRAQESESEED